MSQDSELTLKSTQHKYGYKATHQFPRPIYKLCLLKLLIDCRTYARQALTKNVCFVYKMPSIHVYHSILGNKQTQDKHAHAKILAHTSLVCILLMKHIRLDKICYLSQHLKGNEA